MQDVATDGIMRRLAESFPPLARRTDPMAALVIGLVFGGLGLGIYFRSFRDAVAPVLIVIVLAALFGSTGGVMFGAALAGVYGFQRAESSNRRLAVAPRAAA